MPRRREKVHDRRKRQRLGKRSNGIRDMREQKTKIVLYCMYFDATLNGRCQMVSGFGNRSSSGDGITRRHSLCLACFFLVRILANNSGSRALKITTEDKDRKTGVFLRKKN